MARFDNVNLKIRPLRLALLVDPGSAEQARQAIQLASTLWGGAHFPIIALHKRIPATWREKPVGTVDLRKRGSFAFLGFEFRRVSRKTASSVYAAPEEAHGSTGGAQSNLP